MAQSTAKAKTCTKLPVVCQSTERLAFSVQPWRLTGRCGDLIASYSRPHRAFTIIELLIVIAIITVLLGLLFPALSAIKSAGRQTVESNAAKHLMAAYINYAATHNDKLLPGYASQIPYDANPQTNPGDPTPRVLRAFDAAGNPIAGGSGLDIARRRYLWRLAPYLDYNLRGLYTNDQEELLQRIEQTSYTNYLYVASISPSLGLNSQWMGGDESDYAFRMPRLAGGAASIWSIIDYNHYYLTSMSQALHPARLLVFASARGIDPESSSNKPVEGYFKVQSPHFSEIDPAYRWSQDFNPAESPDRYGYLSPRHGGKAVIGFLDGHSDLLTKEQLKDMRHWANWATTSDWCVPQP